MGQTDLVARAGLVSGSRFFISPICVAWSLSGQHISQVNTPYLLKTLF